MAILVLEFVVYSGMIAGGLFRDALTRSSLRRGSFALFPHSDASVAPPTGGLGTLANAAPGAHGGEQEGGEAVGGEAAAISGSAGARVGSRWHFSCARSCLFSSSWSTR